jgi:D-glycero-D-manno-heptose 1,7-bisphosphate phosphatase
MNRACFIDRDGVLIEEKIYLRDPEQVLLVPEAVAALKLLEQHGFLRIVITNQAGVAHGYFTEADVTAVHDKIKALLLAQKVGVTDFFYCPHHPDGTVSEYALNCACRKPGTALIEQAVKKYDLNLSASFLIGDKISDLLAGRKAGCPAILVKTGHGPEHVAKAKHQNFPIAANILEAVKCFLKGGAGVSPVVPAKE